MRCGRWNMRPSWPYPTRFPGPGSSARIRARLSRNQLKPPKPGYEDPWNDVCRTLWKYGLVSRSEGPGSDAEEVSGFARRARPPAGAQELVRGNRYLAPAIIAARQKSVDHLIDARDDELASVIRWQESRWELEPFEAMALLRAETGAFGCCLAAQQSGLR